MHFDRKKMRFEIAKDFFYRVVALCRIHFDCVRIESSLFSRKIRTPQIGKLICAQCRRNAVTQIAGLRGEIDLAGEGEKKIKYKRAR